MSLTATQHRVRSRNRRVALLVKLEIPNYGDIYLTDNPEPFAISGVTVNPIIISVDGLDMSDQTRVSDIRLTVMNKKTIKQAGNPLATAVRISDLIGEGLHNATFTAKELLAAVKPITITAWDSADLGELFHGPVQQPCDFNAKELTISSTGLERKSYEDLPDAVVGEDPADDPTGDSTPIPVHFGRNHAFMTGWLGPKNISNLARPVKVGRYLQGAHAPVWEYPSTQAGVEQTLVASSRFLAVTDALVEVPGFPGLCIIPEEMYISGTGWQDQWNQRTEASHGHTVIDLTHAPGLYCYYPQRMNDNPRTTYTEDWRELAKPLGYAVLESQNDNVGLATPVLPGVEKDETHLFKAFILCIQLGAFPNDADLELKLHHFNRDATNDTHLITRTFSAADLGPGGYWTSMADFTTCKNKMAADHQWNADDWWKFANSIGGLRCSLKRLDNNGGVLQIRGIYCAIFFRYFGKPADRNIVRLTGSVRRPSYYDPRVRPVGHVGDLSELRFLAAGNGCGEWGQNPAGGDRQSHPSEIYEYILSSELGLSSAQIDIRPVADFWDTIGWKFGWAETEPRRKAKLIDALRQQSTMMMVRDSDGIHRVRLAARYDAKPDWQRFTEPLINGRDIFNVRVRQPGPDWIKNNVRVNYGGRADGASDLAAWGSKTGSGDGFGNALPALKTYAQSSYDTHEFEGRLVIDAWAVRDPDTAVGMRNHYFSTHAEYCSGIEFNAAGIGEFLNVGEYVTLAAEAMDAELLFAGESWGGKWFQILRKAKWGRYWSFAAIEPPKIDLVGMVPAVVLFPTPISG